MVHISVNGLTIPAWIPALILLLTAIAIAALIQRRRTRFQRHFGRTLNGVKSVQGSIHPDAERVD
jgi:hypothetical protein